MSVVWALQRSARTGVPKAFPKRFLPGQALLQLNRALLVLGRSPDASMRSFCSRFAHRFSLSC
jgi:hypothetical protein